MIDVPDDAWDALAQLRGGVSSSAAEEVSQMLSPCWMSIYAVVILSAYGYSDAQEELPDPYPSHWARLARAAASRDVPRMKG